MDQRPVHLRSGRIAMDFNEWERKFFVRNGVVLSFYSTEAWEAARKGMVPVERLKKLLDSARDIGKSKGGVQAAFEFDIWIDDLIKEYGE